MVYGGWCKVAQRGQANQLKYRKQARDEALRILGVAECYALDFPDNCMDSIPLLDVVQSLEPIIEAVQPGCLLIILVI